MESSTKTARDSSVGKVPALAILRAWAIGLATSGVVLLTLYLALPPVYGEAKIWRSGHFAEAGNQAFAKGEWEAAIDWFKLAAQLDPGNPEFLRQTARASEKISVSRANDLWNGIMSRATVSTAARQDYTEFLLRIGRIDFANEQLKLLLMGKAPPARSLSLASDFFRLRGELETAVMLAKRALIAAPDDADIQFKLGSLLASDDTQKERLDGRRLLWDLAQRTNSMQFSSWKRLVATGELKAGEADQILAWIQAAGRDEEDRLLVADLILISQPGSKDAVVKTISGGPVPTDAEVLAETVSWLNSKSAFAEAHSLVPLDRVGTNLTLLSVHLDSLIGLKRWDALEGVLSRTNSPVDPTVADCIRARAAASRGDGSGADAIWKHLVSSTTNAPIKARMVAVEAERFGRKDVALDVYSHFVTYDSFIGIEANRQTYRIARSLSRFDLAKDAATRLARYDGRDVAAVASMVYLNLLLKNQVRQSLETASTMARLNPDQPSIKVLHAFAYLRNDDPKKALALVEDLKSQFSFLPPQWRAVTAAIMKANGRITEQVQLLESLDNSGFNKEELKLILN